jgi:hypothetical protein
LVSRSFQIGKLVQAIPKIAPKAEPATVYLKGGPNRAAQLDH